MPRLQYYYTTRSWRTSPTLTQQSKYRRRGMVRIVGRKLEQEEEDEEEEASLLEFDERRESEAHTPVCVRSWVFSAPQLVLWCIFTSLLSAAFGGLVTWILIRALNLYPRNSLEVYSPAHNAVRYSERPMGFDDTLYPNPFIGDPRPELDQAWSQLLSSTYFRVTSEEFSKFGLNRSTLGVVGSGEKVISFSVYHELHCLKTLYRWIHKDHYFASLSEDSDEYNFQRWHTEHCISYLRQATMCKASLSPVTLDWFEAVSGQPRPRPNTHSPQSCMDWTSLNSWTEKRKIDLYDLDSLADMPGRGW
ncbi:hypothetical protein BCR34DRAFT_590757 [Clohesyomyces aquaticus]|uniref:Tat pathway signal sequence n=1 Tax=Clohesyomyces aquaticus TaxID=1231657 RepID=A0A1Y1Z6I1_9PLEO|nr:hypothetical protein BCR34DRAFT_590757 [Clohesyomyces aquaticus]